MGTPVHFVSLGGMGPARLVPMLLAGILASALVLTPNRTRRRR